VVGVPRGVAPGAPHTKPQGLVRLARVGQQGGDQAGQPGRHLHRRAGQRDSYPKGEAIYSEVFFSDLYSTDTDSMTYWYCTIYLPER